MKRSISLTVVTYVAFVTLFMLCGFCCLGIVQAQGVQIAIPDGPQSITNSNRPMMDAADLLQRMYVVPVTYEDPILTWSEDIDLYPSALGEMLGMPKRRNFAIPDEANPRKTPKLDAGLLKRVVDAYQEQTDGPRFKIASSRWGLHLIPDLVRDRNGQFIKAATFLDAFISVPMKRRTPAGHFYAICDAVNASTSTGIRFEFFESYTNQYFSEKPSEELEAIAFDWGIEGMVARDALIDLLEQSATTMTWLLLCDTRRLCALNIVPLAVNYLEGNGEISKRALFHDRKKERKE